jgi:uncharacterized protein YacL (UPF0231 family)
MQVNYKTLSAVVGAIITTSSITYGVVNVFIIEELKTDISRYEKKVSVLESQNSSFELKIQELEHALSGNENKEEGLVQNNSVVIDGVQVTNDQAKASSSPSAVAQRGAQDYKKNVSGGIVHESNSFEFRMNSCELSGSVLTLDFYVTDLRDNRHLDLSNRIRVIDDSGNEYSVKKMVFGKTISNGSIGKDMLRDVPVKMQIVFDGVNSDIKYINALQIFAYSGGAFDFTIKNIKVLR